MKSCIKLKIDMVILYFVFACCLQYATAQGNLIFNGAFDTNASGWTISGLGGFVSTIGNPPGSLLFLSSSMTASSTASQTIGTLTPEDIYIISGDYRLGAKKDATPDSFSVALDGILMFETTAPTDFNWHIFSFEYTANSMSALLSLSWQMNGTDTSYAIDNIAMYVVPEPSAWSLLLLGGGVFLYVRTRKQHAA